MAFLGQKRGGIIGGHHIQKRFCGKITCFSVEMFDGKVVKSDQSCFFEDGVGEGGEIRKAAKTGPAGSSCFYTAIEAGVICEV